MGFFLFRGFRAWHQARPDPTPRNMLEEHRQDPHDDEYFELPYQQTLIDAFIHGLCKESQHDFRSFQHCLPACQVRVQVRETIYSIY
jgi:hypothetical protein